MTTVETPVTSQDQMVIDLLAKVDEFIRDITHQSIVDQGKVLDFTLDIRNIINEVR